MGHLQDAVLEQMGLERRFRVDRGVVTDFDQVEFGEVVHAEINATADL